MLKIFTDRFATFAQRRLLCFGFGGFENCGSLKLISVWNWGIPPCAFPIKHVCLFRALTYLLHKHLYFHQNSFIACLVRIFSIVTMGTQNNPPSNLRSKSSFSQYVSLRQQLDDLGYNNYLSNESVPLVDKLLRDLLQYKELCMGSQKHHQTARKVTLVFYYPKYFYI
jgi:hypothetical protein